MGIVLVLIMAITIATSVVLWTRWGPGGDPSHPLSDGGLVLSLLAGIGASSLVMMGVTDLWPRYVSLWGIMMGVEWLVGVIMHLSTQN